MNTKAVFVWMAALMLLLSCDFAAARGDSSFGGGFHSGGGGFHSNGGGGGNRGVESHHDGMHRFGRFNDFRGRGLIIIGDPFFWSPYFYDWTLYPATSELIYEQPGASFSYYCTNPAGYYPDIQHCPPGWLRVVPDVPPN